MKTILIGLIGGVVLSAATIPAGWTVIKDAKNSCQIGVPADFKSNPALPSLANDAAHLIEVQIVAQPGKTVKPLSDMAQKAVGVDKMFDNTANRLFYATKPVKTHDGKVLTEWRVTVGGKDGTCFGTITMKGGASEDTAKKIADSFGAAK